MAGSRGRRLLTGLFGREGSVALEAELQIAVVATMVSVSGIFVVSPIVATLAGPLGTTPAAAGQLITAFTAPSILLTPVMGLLADRLGRKPVLVGGLALFGVAGASIALASTMPVALVLRGIQGIGYAAIIPVGVALLGDVYEAEREATAQGMRVAGIQTISLLSPPVAGALVLLSWRAPFLLYGLSLLVAVWAWRRLPRVHPGEPRPVGGYVADLLGSLRRPVMAAIMLSFAARFLLIFAVFAYISVLLASAFGASAVVSGIALGGLAVVSLSSSTQIGRLTARIDGVLVVLVGFVLLGVGMVVLGLAPSYPVVGAGLLLLGLGAGISGPAQKSLVTQLAAPSLRAGAVSTAVIFQAIGQTAGPALFGLIISRAPPATAFVGVGIAGSLAGILLMVVARRFAARGRLPGPA